MKLTSKRWFIFSAGLITGVLVLLLVAGAVFAGGAINMGATSTPMWAEEKLATWAVERSMARRASDEKNPFADDPQALAVGLEHYSAMCVMCHGAPGVPSSEIGAGLNPPPPSLEAEVDELTDGELFWAIKNGIRMTGMPGFGETHSDDGIWKMAAFVRHLPDLTDEEKANLANAAEEGQHADDHPHHAEAVEEEAAGHVHDQQASQPATQRIQPPTTLPHDHSITRRLGRGADRIND